MKEIRLNAFEMNCVGHQSPGLWAHPRDRSLSYTDLGYWTGLAKTLEKGRFDGIFLADVLGHLRCLRRLARRGAAPCRAGAGQRPAHMGMFAVKGQVRGSWVAPRSLFRIQGLSPFSMTRWRVCTRSSSHTVAACCGCTNIPRSAGGAQEAGTILFARLLRPTVASVRPPGSGRTDQVLADGVRSSPAPPSSRPPR